MSDLETLEKLETQDAPTLVKPSTQKRPWRWQWLIAPLMGVSLLLHIGLLFVPLPSLDVAEEAPPEDEAIAEAEAAPVDILSLSDIAAPEPPSEPPATPPQQPQPQSPQAPPPSGAVPPPPDPAQPIQESPPQEEAFVDELPVEEGFSDNPPAFDAGAATEQFVGDISGLGVADYTSQLGLPTPELLRNPGNAACFIDPTGGAAPGVRVANWLDKEPQTLLSENLQAVYGPRGITFEELEPFCGERYFRALTAEGQSFMTFSLVTLQGSTLLVVWDTPPL